MKTKKLYRSRLIRLIRKADGLAYKFIIIDKHKKLHKLGYRFLAKSRHLEYILKCVNESDLLNKEGDKLAINYKF